MTKRIRQYIGIMSAVAAYYLIHEGAHLICALMMGTFKQINVIGLGIQIDVEAASMTSWQMALFCVAGTLATLFIAYCLTLAARVIAEVKSPLLRAVMYYITIALLLLDPLYLSLLCGLFGGGDMNGIRLVCPELLVRGVFAGILVINGIVFVKHVLPIYQKSFQNNK